MNEFSACPDPEVLGAFIDGRLTGVERRRVVEHLDACEDCYAVFSETVRFQGEEEPRGRVLGSGRFGSQQWVWAAAAAAAVLVVLVAVPVLRMSPSGPAASAKALVAALTVADETELAAALRPGRLAGEMDFAQEMVSEEETSFRAGVVLVERMAAVRARDSGVEVVEIEAPPLKARKPFYLAFGQWADAGRLAAVVGDTGFFRSPIFTELQTEIAEAELPEDVSEVLREIRAVTLDGGSEPLEPADLAVLRELFTKLVAMY